jgi:two-component system, OmpR family, alkaline phosphatase synthesis response regulator PhoP
MRVLLAEDDPNISLIMQICLERIGGHIVVVCEDGEQAFDTAMSDHFDLIILDGNMPKMSGLQVAEAIREAGSLEVPLIFLSARTDERDIARFKAFGIGYIPKPFDPQQICTKIDEFLLKRRGYAV